jgi:RHH-type proline utilization regulon transcriptional repressor/proline dehydrogenase/delta 1-pyrroline-5-carboxylate dehydrogenase
MFCDTTALREQVVDDVIMSGFRSAGQRCSALRILFLPHETADDIIEMIKGAMDVLVIGDPANPSTDVGPIIDAEARKLLDDHFVKMTSAGFATHQRDIGALREKGTFFGPSIVELPSLSQIDKEVFGPILHVVRYDPDDIEKVGGELSAKGYGLTLGVHSRLEGFAEKVKAAVRAGNVYVNRSIIGAVVGVQPFGGSGLSGTGPKGWRPALSRALRHRADRHGEHCRAGRRPDPSQSVGARIDRASQVPWRYFSRRAGTARVDRHGAYAFAMVNEL